MPPNSTYNPIEAAPAVLPMTAPESRTAKVCPVMGTGVKGSGMAIWAAPAVSSAKPITRPMVTVRLRGSTRAAKTVGA